MVSYKCELGICCLPAVTIPTPRTLPGVAGWIHGDLRPRGCPEHISVIGDPLPERPRGRSDDVGDGGCHVRRVSDRRTPRVEQNVHDRTGPGIHRLPPELFRRQLLEADPATEDIADLAHLLCLAQGLGA